MLDRLKKLLEENGSAPGAFRRMQRISFLAELRQTQMAHVTFCEDKVEVRYGFFTYNEHQTEAFYQEQPLILVDDKNDFPSEKLISQLQLVRG